MIGYFIVEKFGEAQDAAGASTTITARNKMDMNIVVTLYLPPYLRKTQCDISAGDTVFGVADDITGIGAAIFGNGAADFKYFFDADVTIKKNLTVTSNINSTTGNIKANAGDVVATTVSLKSHIHPITSITCTDAAAIVGIASAQPPAAATLSAFYTVTPT